MSLPAWIVTVENGLKAALPGLIEAGEVGADLAGDTAIANLIAQAGGIAEAFLGITANAATPVGSSVNAVAQAVVNAKSVLPATAAS
jgi:hypothetical protein